jgi:hypothetical protein
MISLLASLHAIATQRGEGVRPDLIRLSATRSANFEADPVSGEATEMREGVLPAFGSV